jgi:HEAT repeat protein
MKEVPFSTVVAALGDSGRPFPTRYLNRFSDLNPADLQTLMQAWPRVPLAHKRTLLKHLNERYAEDTLLSFDALAVQLLDDPDEQVRTLALQLLDETADIHLLPRLIRITSDDPEPASRAAAATILGQFVHMGEMEELPADTLNTVTDTLLVAAANPDNHIARAALESLGYSGRPEVNELIASAFKRRDPHWQVSALLAAGHSADARWQEQVLAALISDDEKVRLAAVQTAGELGLKPARQVLLNMLEEEEEFGDIYQAIIWSLSQIGGEDVRPYLQTLLGEADDDEMAELIEDALQNLDFTEDLEGFDLIAYDADDEPKKGKKK